MSNSLCTDAKKTDVDKRLHLFFVSIRFCCCCPARSTISRDCLCCSSVVGLWRCRRSIVWAEIQIRFECRRSVKRKGMFLVWKCNPASITENDFWPARRIRREKRDESGSSEMDNGLRWKFTLILPERLVRDEARDKHKETVTHLSTLSLSRSPPDNHHRSVLLLVLPCLHLIYANAYEGYHQPPDRLRPNKTRLLFAHSTFHYPMTRTKPIE